MQNANIANQQRCRIGLFKGRQSCNRFRVPAGLDVAIGEIKGDVIADIAGMRLGSVQWIDGLAQSWSRNRPYPTASQASAPASSALCFRAKASIPE